MAHELFGGIDKDVFYAAMALELFHNFTLIHDDIMDEAPLRRGRATIHARYGLPSGILSGDVMNIYAYQQLARIHPDHLTRILPVFNRTAIEVCEGQQMDMDFENKEDITVDEYLKMIALKTSVLLASSLKIGACLAGATAGEANHIYEFGRNLGLAFQLQDDYLDTFGSQEQIGKLPGGDIRANKKTFLYINCQELADDNESKILKELRTSNEPDKVQKTKALFQKLEIDKRSRSLIEFYSRQSFGHLEKLNKTATQISPLKSLAIHLLNRTN
jgi:geranylgeranyl diphosphate synthase type II